MLEDFSGDEPLPGGVDVDAVVGEPVVRVTSSGFGQVFLNGAVDINDVPAVGLLSQQPLGVAVEHLIVALVGLSVFGEAHGETSSTGSESGRIPAA